MSDIPEDERNSKCLPGQYSKGMKLFRERFILEERLRDDVVSECWLAKDSKLGDECALKFIPTEIVSDPRALGRIKREVRSVRKLTHPRIVKIEDCYVESDSAAVAMTYVKGKTLIQLLAEKESGFFEPNEIGKWIKDVCDALEYAHNECDLVHGALTPNNIIVGEDAGFAYVMDFGISRRIEEAYTQVTGKNESGTMLYMSPQQRQGELAVLADDVYSFGATLYEQLTGTPPFYRGDVKEQILSIVPEGINKRRRQLASENMITGTGKPVPENWEVALAQCLEKERGERPSSVSVLRQLLFRDELTVFSAKSTQESIVDESGVAADSEMVEPTTPATARKGAVATILIGLLVMGLGFGATLWAVKWNSSNSNERQASGRTTKEPVVKPTSGGSAPSASSAEASTDSGKHGEEYTALWTKVDKALDNDNWDIANEALDEMRKNPVAVKQELDALAKRINESQEQAKAKRELKESQAKLEKDSETQLGKLQTAIQAARLEDALDYYAKWTRSHSETKAYKTNISGIEQSLSQLRDKKKSGAFGGLSQANKSAKPPFKWHPVKYQGIKYVQVSDVMKFYGFSKLTEGLEIVLEKKNVRIRMNPNTKKCRMNGVLFIISHPIIHYKGEYRISWTDLVKLIDPVMRISYVKTAKVFRPCGQIVFG